MFIRFCIYYIKLFCIILYKFTAIFGFNCNNLEINRVFKTSSEGLEYEKFGTLVAMFYALPCVIVY